MLSCSDEGTHTLSEFSNESKFCWCSVLLGVSIRGGRKLVVFLGGKFLPVFLPVAC